MDIFVKCDQKNNEGFNFQNWVSNGPFNQITLFLIQVILGYYLISF